MFMQERIQQQEINFEEAAFRIKNKIHPDCELNLEDGIWRIQEIPKDEWLADRKKFMEENNLSPNHPERLVQKMVTVMEKGEEEKRWQWTVDYKI